MKLSLKVGSVLTMIICSATFNFCIGGVKKRLAFERPLLLEYINNVILQYMIE